MGNRISHACIIVAIPLLLFGCSVQETHSDASQSDTSQSDASQSINDQSSLSSHPDTVTLHFTQLKYKDDENGVTYFYTDIVLAQDAKEYEYGHELTVEEIDDFRIKVKYKPSNSCYYFFTSFFLKKEEPTYEDAIKPCTLVEDLELYFGVYP